MFVIREGLYAHPVESLYTKTAYFIKIYLSTAIGLTPGGSVTVHTINT